jgi:hypothetical protein
MMDHMPSPKQIDFVAHSMCPIITEVIEEKQDQESPDSIGDLEKSEFFKQKGINSYRYYFYKDTRNLGHHPTIDVGDGIVHPITRVFMKAQHDQFNTKSRK